MTLRCQEAYIAKGSHAHQRSDSLHSAYRIVYEIHDEWVVVEVIRVGHRGEVHRRS